MQIIDGKKIAADIIARLKARPKPEGFFAAILVGDDAASLHFLKQKEKVARELDIDFRLYTLPATTSTDALRHEIGRLAGPTGCGACIVQLPLPEGINRHYVLNAIPKEKDLDILSEAALGAFYTGRHPIVPPSVGAVEEILTLQDRALRELKVVVIGAGFLIGKPIGFWLQNRVAELSVLDSRVTDLRSHLHGADVVVSGAGQANLFSPDDLKDGALVIDFGWNPSTHSINSGPAGPRVVGDFAVDREAESYKLKAISYTPMPGGTGPILVAKLFENFYILNSSQ